MPQGVRQSYKVLVRQELARNFITTDYLGRIIICELMWGSQTLLCRRFHLERRPGRMDGRDVLYCGKLYKWIEEPQDAALLVRAEFIDLAYRIGELFAISD